VRVSGRRRSRRLAALGFVALICGCRGERAPNLSSRTRTSDAPPACTDSVEARALACSGRTARRIGETLFVRLGTGRETTFIDDQTSEAPGGFHYAGRVGRERFHLVESYGHETAPLWIFINARTGRQVVAPDKPVVSPDTARFTTASDSWNNCAELDQPRMEVWRLTDTLPVLEWRLDAWNCKTQTGWGPTDPHWVGSDTVRFTRNDMELPARVAADSSNQPIYHTRPMLAVHDRKGWRVVDQP
jgi:hypothetical protein